MEKTRNKGRDLHNILFEQLERLSDSEITGDNLKQEIARGKAVADIASKIIDNGNLILNHAKFTAEYDGEKKPSLPLFND